MAVSFFARRSIRSCRIYQGVLESVSTGTENVACHRDFFAHVQIRLDALGTSGIIGHRIGVAGYLLSRVLGEIKALGQLQLVVAEVGFLQGIRQMNCSVSTGSGFTSHPRDSR